MRVRVRLACTRWGDTVMTHRTIALLLTLAFGLFVAALATNAQPLPTVHRIGLLRTGTALAEQPFLESIRQGLHDLGYVEGQNLVLEVRYAEGGDDRLRDLAADLVQLPVEVIVAGGSAAIRAAQHATRTIPIVMALSADPVARGFVASLARPEGNITGVSWLGAELGGKQLEMLKEAVPQVSRVAVFGNPASPGYGPGRDNLTVAAQALGLHLQVVELRRADEVDHALVAMTHAGAEALLVLAEPLLIDGLRGRIAELAATSRLPAMYGWRMYVEAGGLMSYGPSLPDLRRRAVSYVDRILKGAKPADLPVEQPTKFELVINLKTAQALGLTIPPTLLFQADEVIR
jgi:putative tryptophan/tyrosine transport system substrate-binding protein